MFDNFFRKIKASLLGIRGLSIHLLQAPLWLALPISLLQGRLAKTVILSIVIGLITYGGVLTQRYFRACRDNYLKSGKAFSLEDNRPHALGFIALGVFILVSATLRRPLLLSIITSAIAGLGYYLRYMAADQALSDYPEEDEKVSTDHLSPTLRDMLNNAYDSIESLENSARYLLINSADDNLGKKLIQVNQKARTIIKIIYESPEKIRQARTFLVVYLKELDEVSRQYILQMSLDKYNIERKNFEQLLEQTLLAFQDQQLSLTQSHQEQLDIRMQVLREQLNSMKVHERK